MLPIGMEYGFVNRVNVVKTNPTDWEESKFDISGFIAEANKLKSYKIFSEDNEIVPIETVKKRVFCFLKTSKDKEEKALIIINNDRYYHQHIHMDLAQVMGSSLSQIKDISVEYAMSELPVVLDYGLRPAQVMIFYLKA